MSSMQTHQGSEYVCLLLMIDSRFHLLLKRMKHTHTNAYKSHVTNDPPKVV